MLRQNAQSETQATRVFRWLTLLATTYCVVVLGMLAWQKLQIDVHAQNPINASAPVAYAMLGLIGVGVVSMGFNLRRSTQMIFGCYAVVFWTLVILVLGLLMRLQHGADTASLLMILLNLIAFGFCVMHHKAQHYL